MFFLYKKVIMKFSYFTYACWERFILRLVSPVVRQGELSHDGEPVMSLWTRAPFYPEG